jgi:hypothetical protein
MKNLTNMIGSSIEHKFADMANKKECAPEWALRAAGLDLVWGGSLIIQLDAMHGDVIDVLRNENGQLEVSWR